MTNGIITDDILYFPHKLVDLLIKNAPLARALANEEVTDPNSLVKKYIFPFKYPEEKLSLTAQSYITMSASVFPADSKTYMGIKIQLHIFCHEDVREMDLNGFSVDRAMFMWLKAHEELSVTRELGIGLLNFEGLIPLEVNENYSGVKAVYTTRSFAK